MTPNPSPSAATCVLITVGDDFIPLFFTECFQTHWRVWSMNGLFQVTFNLLTLHFKTVNHEQSKRVNKASSALCVLTVSDMFLMIILCLQRQDEENVQHHKFCHLSVWDGSLCHLWNDTFLFRCFIPVVIQHHQLQWWWKAEQDKYQLHFTWYRTIKIYRIIMFFFYIGISTNQWIMTWMCRNDLKRQDESSHLRLDVGVWRLHAHPPCSPQRSHKLHSCFNTELTEQTWDQILWQVWFCPLSTAVNKQQEERSSSVLVKLPSLIPSFIFILLTTKR